MNRTGVLALLAALALAPTPGQATPRSRETFEARIAAELRERSPEAAALWAQGNAARTAGDHAKAASLFEKVATLVPEFSHAKRRLAGEELALGRRSQAIALCRQALAQDPSPENMIGLAHALSREVGSPKPTPAEMKEAYLLALRAVAKAPDDFYAQATLAQLALANDEASTFRKAADRLLEIAPDEVATHHIAFLRALTEERWDDAEAALGRAHALGLPNAEYQKMLGLLKAGSFALRGTLVQDGLGGGRVARLPGPAPRRRVGAERRRAPRSVGLAPAGERTGPGGRRDPQEGLRRGALALLRVLLRVAAHRGPRRRGRGRRHPLRALCHRSRSHQARGHRRDHGPGHPMVDAQEPLRARQRRRSRPDGSTCGRSRGCALCSATWPGASARVPWTTST